jgi:cellulose synthase/poly-beta-1,6-N-acetylglucosamine synthase-like glycosyltransferase
MHVSKLKDFVSTPLSNYIFYILRHNFLFLENINSFLSFRPRGGYVIFQTVFMLLLSVRNMVPTLTSR